MKRNQMILISLLTACVSLTACEWQEPLGDAFLNANEEDYKITSCDNLQYIKHNSQDEDYYCAKDESVCKALKEKSENIKCSLWNEHPCNGFDTQKIDGQIVNNFEYAFKYNKCTIKHHECPNMQLKIKEDNYCQNKEIFRCASGQTTCQNEEGEVSCLNPSSNETCGATCDKPEGTLCETDKNLSCQQDDSSEAYKCQCFSGFVDCDGQCLDPQNDKNHCGSTTASCAELKKCENDQFCNEGQCTCNPGTYLCDGECKSPDAPETCGINEKCEFKTCGTNETCSITENGYQCELTSCDNDNNLCTTTEGRKCISKDDLHNCGGCNIECQNQLPANAKNPTCTSDGKCDFECETGYLKCGGRCVAIGADNCGECNITCDKNEKCYHNQNTPNDKGTCVPSGCNDDQCELANGTVSVCVSENSACGKDCIDCTGKYGKDATCVNNRCSFTCKDNQHPIYAEGIMLDCEDNIAVACGTKDAKSNNDVIDCTQDLTSKNANSSSCVDSKCKYECNENFVWSDTENKCVCPTQTHFLDSNNFCKPYITTCDTGYHVAKDRKSCVQNTQHACGKITWDGTGDYSQYVIDCGNNDCHNNGTCCNDNYSPNAINVCLPNYCPNVNRDHITKMENNCFVHECNNNYDVNNQENNNGCVCSSDKTDCGDFCVDLNTDTNNCGECGNECQQGESCIYGSCQSIIQCNNNNCNDCNNNIGKYCQIKNFPIKICTDEFQSPDKFSIKCLDIIDCKNKSRSDYCNACEYQYLRQCLRKSYNNSYELGKCTRENYCE